MKHEKKVGTHTDTDRQTHDTHPGANYSRRRNLFRRRQKLTKQGRLHNYISRVKVGKLGLDRVTYRVTYTRLKADKKE